MKTLILSLLLLLAATMAALAAAAADPIEGTWRTRPDDNGNIGYVRIAPCGAAFCGKLVKAVDGAGKPVPQAKLGVRILWDMKPEGKGAYAGGKVWSPDRDKTYSGKLELAGDRLSVSGCVMGGLVCRNGGIWTRVD